MMKRAIDKIDLLIAGGVSAFVFALACLWAYPYPHPDLWPFISEFRVHISCETLGLLGRLSLGAFAGMAYLLLRIFWLRNLHPEDEFPDCFFFDRSSSLFGALLFSTLPGIWRSAQFLSPAFLFVVVELLGLIAWQLSRGYGRYLTYSLSYLLLAIVAAFNPFAFALLGYVAVSDVIARWQQGLAHGQQEEDLDTKRKSMQELVFSVITGIFGFLGGILLFARYVALHDFTWSIPRIFADWWPAWLAAFDDSITSPFMLTLAAVAIAAIVAAALGRRVRSVGEYGRTMAIALACVQGLVTTAVVIRAYDGDARMRLGVIRDFIGEVVCDTGDARWFFSDGRFDDMLRYAFLKAGRPAYVMDVMHAPTIDEGERMRKMAPSFGERDLFAAGGAEVFRAWARERPDRLAESAWFTGGGVLKLFNKTVQRTCGSVMRAQPTEGVAKDFDEADARQTRFLERVIAETSVESLWRRVFGNVDRALAEKFDAVLWRVARQASARSERYEANGDINGATVLQERVRSLNARNGTLYAQGEALERLLQTVNLVPTPREALELALKRADFLLAQRYANEVLQVAPDDVQANFAIGMVNLQAKEYFLATRNFEKVLKSKPGEPATLNNLSIAYLKLGQLDRAREHAERALKANPDSQEIKQTLATIAKELDKER